MKTISPAELVHLIETQSKSLKALAATSKKTTDSDGCHPRIKVMDGVAVGWISSRNYCGGVANGYGPGLYAFVRTCGTAVQSVRLMAA